MQNNKEHIFLLVQAGYSARNFVLSGFLNQEKAKITFWSDQNYLLQYKNNNDFVELPKEQYSTKLNLLKKIKNKAEIFFNTKTFQNKNYKFYLDGINKKQSIKVKFKNFLITLIATLFSSEKGIEYLDKPFHKLTRKTAYYKACKNQLLKHKPTIVFCTHQRASSGVAPMLAAKDLGIKTVCFIHSWDNIPKGVLLIKADEYFVWSDYMKEEMIGHYPFIKKSKIKVTGTPQFIPYFNKKYRLKRVDFFNRFKLDCSKKYILFSGNDKTTSPNDPVFLSDLCETILKLNQIENNLYKILFRPNPIDRNDGFNTVLKKYESLVTEIQPDWFGSETFLWNQGGPNENDIILLINTILHSEIVVNLGSTMALDAALLNKATCYINYDISDSIYNWSVKKIYKFLHFKIIKDLNAVFWINDRQKILPVIQDALNNSSKTKIGREQWINRVTTLPIKDTNNRMWNYLIKTNEV